MTDPTSERVYISPVAYRAQVTITNPDFINSPDIGMGSPIFRIPEFVRRDKARRPPGYTKWEIVQPDTELRYQWAPPEKIKKEFPSDFRGYLKVEDTQVRYEITYKNIGDDPASDGVSLFCLQAGTMREFHDLEQVNTFVWVNDRFVSLSENRQPTTRNLIVKRSAETGFVLAVATEPSSGVGGNPNIWPSCIHSNPDWGTLQPGEEATVHGAVYFFRGSLDDVMERYLRDFGT